MALDSNIALQTKLPTFDNPLTQYAQVAAIQNAQQQNRLADLAYGEKQREVEQTNALNNIYKGAVGADGAIDRNKLYTGAASGGLGSKIPGLQKGFAETDKAVADLAQSKSKTAETDGKLAVQRQEAIGNTLGAIAQIPNATPQHVVTGIQHLVDIGQIAPEMGQKIIAGIPQDPSQLQGWLVQGRNAVMKAADQMKYTTVDANTAANNNTSLATTGMNNRTTLAANAATNQTSLATNANTVNATVRGQDLTNDRALEINDSKREEARLKAAAEKAPNSEQGKAMSYAARMQQSHAIMEDMLAGGTKTPSKIKGALDSIPLVGEGLGSVANTFVASKDQQKLEQAQRDFINADLRHESGASISPAEFDNARRQYFPMPGDGPDVIAQKAQNRRIAIEGMKVQAGPGAAKIDGILDRSSIDLTKVKPGTPEYKAVMADAANIGALRNKAKPAAKPSLDDIFGK